SDGDSLRSVGSLASVRTTATAAVGINRINATRARSNTTQTGPSSVAGLLASWQPTRGLGIPRHVRTPSIASNSSAMTVDSTRVLRDDTRVSSRSWWPQTWGWGSSGSSAATALPPSTVATHAEPLMTVFEQDVESATDPATTFLFTGEHAFPGMEPSATATSVDGGSEYSGHPATQRAEENGSGSGGDQDDQETSSRLGMAMVEEMPSVYEHGVNVDRSRGVVLAPRGIPGMQYDTKQLHRLYNPGTQTGAYEQTTFPEIPLFMRPSQDTNADGMCRTLVYRYGQMLYFVFGQCRPKTTEDDEVPAVHGIRPPPTMHKRITKKQRKMGAGG
ncbi:hypothetical protein LPJ75_006733, partial [Coemansia sp. RSA 2598]